MCSTHERLLARKCLAVGCQADIVPGSRSCHGHMAAYQRHKNSKSQATLSGLCRILQHPNDQQPWQNRQVNRINPAHDQNQGGPEDEVRRHYWSPNRFYCVETICTPCGLVVSWTKFAKSESPTNILNWLQQVYPEQDNRPSYICIDKACQVVRRAVTTGQWEEWKETTRFIVDSYHYVNHQATDFLCQKWCNPAPTDGSAPNLVTQQIGDDGEVYTVSYFYCSKITCTDMIIRLGCSILKHVNS